MWRLLVGVVALVSAAAATGSSSDGFPSVEAPQEPPAHGEGESPFWPPELLQECLGLQMTAHQLLFNSEGFKSPLDGSQVQLALTYVKKVKGLVMSMLSNFDKVPQELCQRRVYYEGIFENLGLLRHHEMKFGGTEDGNLVLETCGIKFAVLGEAVEHLIDIRNNYWKVKSKLRAFGEYQKLDIHLNCLRRILMHVASKPTVLACKVGCASHPTVRESLTLRKRCYQKYLKQLAPAFAKLALLFVVPDTPASDPQEQEEMWQMFARYLPQPNFPIEPPFQPTAPGLGASTIGEGEPLIMKETEWTLRTEVEIERLRLQCRATWAREGYDSFLAVDSMLIVKFKDGPLSGDLLTSLHERLPLVEKFSMAIVEAELFDEDRLSAASFDMGQLWQEVSRSVVPMRAFEDDLEIICSQIYWRITQDGGLDYFTEPIVNVLERYQRASAHVAEQIEAFLQRLTKESDEMQLWTMACMYPRILHPLKFLTTLGAVIEKLREGGVAITNAYRPIVLPEVPQTTRDSRPIGEETLPKFAEPQINA